MLCPLCKGAQQNLKHVLSHCDAALKDNRYSERHDGVLQLLVERMNLVAEEQYPEEIISKRPRIWADLDGYNSHILTRHQSPHRTG